MTRQKDRLVPLLTLARTANPRCQECHGRVTHFVRGTKICFACYARNLREHQAQIKKTLR